MAHKVTLIPGDGIGPEVIQATVRMLEATGVNNVVNKYPPTDATVFSDPPADIGIYGAIGRFYYVDVAYKF